VEVVQLGNARKWFDNIDTNFNKEIARDNFFIGFLIIYIEGLNEKINLQDLDYKLI